MARAHVAAGRGGVWSLHAMRMRNYACLGYAVEFHNIARKAGFPIIRAFLLGQAIELYLKAFLFHQGYGETRLKKSPFGHNLPRLLNEAAAKGLDANIHVSPALRTDLDRLNTLYSSKALQYFSILYLITNPTLPKVARLFRFAGQLNRHLVGLIREPT